VTDVPQRFVVDLEGVRLLDRYVVEARIGEGGMGTVYRGRDAQLDLPVVVKVPHARLLGEEGFRTRFEREIEGLIALQHPHVVRILARGEHEGMPYLVLQYLDGGSLADRMEAAPAGRILPREALTWLEDVARALDFMHEQGILHRDVKPENILFDEHGNVFLSDFGIAKVLTDPKARLTQTGIAPGSPEYMAPEQAMGVALTGAADQYALAATLYEALSGKLPFDGDTPLALLVKKQNEQPVPLREVAPEVSDASSDAVMAALATDPKERYPSVREFARAFEYGMIGTPVPTPNRGTPMLPTVPAGAGARMTPPSVAAGYATPVPGGTTPWPGAPFPAEPRRSRAPWVAAVALILIGAGVALGTAAGWFDRQSPTGNGPVVVPPPVPATKVAVRLESPEPDAVVVGEPAPEARAWAARCAWRGASREPRPVRWR
jgi:serine/threonine-protein kinase